ncbi:MAG TPA: (2Fe-2S)-binding protein [Candidatus Limnocylindria bacterium]|nr:(2Fe-2S)-binding protein [Candidatus Limnocylindria bacterium]
MPILLTVNGSRYEVAAEPRWTLAELLRDQLGLTGTKIPCDRGECGGCTVLLDGLAVLSCTVLAPEADGRQILTVEGLAAAGQELSPLQESFVNAGAVQCGFCTPGMLMSARALLDRNPHPSEREAREAIAGNLCRCTGYTKIVEGILKAASA